jgi:tRNA(Ile)-lysidine synthase
MSKTPDIITDQAFDTALERCGLSAASALALAVSGGGDSMALAVLCARVLLPRGVRLKAYTVDHGLRSGAGAEAAAAGRTLAALGIAHEILIWTDQKPETHVQERARAARYALLATACRRDGFDALLTAHQAEDQMETFWMRLAHGSGLDGLAAMAPQRRLQGGLRLVRPLLGFGRTALRETCRRAKIEWAEDPTNENDKYLRPRLRGFEEILAAEGLTPERLAQVTQKLADARTALDHIAAEKTAACAQIYPEGYVRLDAAALSQLPHDLARRVLSRLLLLVAPADYPPGFDLLENLRCDLALAGFAGRTAFGCDLSVFGTAGTVLIAREAAALPPPAPLGTAAHPVWDRRFVLSGLPARHRESVMLGALGTAGVAMLRKQAAGDKNIPAALERLPGKVRAALPALWQGEKLLCVPHLSWHDAAAAADCAGIRADFPAEAGGVSIRSDCFGGV